MEGVGQALGLSLHRTFRDYIKWYLDSVLFERLRHGVERVY